MQGSGGKQFQNGGADRIKGEAINMTIKLMMIFYGNSTVVAKSFWTPRFFPLNGMVNKSCRIECCGNKMHQIVQNMILTLGLELTLIVL